MRDLASPLAKAVNWDSASDWAFLKKSKTMGRDVVVPCRPRMMTGWFRFRWMCRTEGGHVGKASKVGRDEEDERMVAVAVTAATAAKQRVLSLPPS